MPPCPNRRNRMRPSALVGSFPLVPPSSPQRHKAAPAPAKDGDGDDGELALPTEELLRLDDGTLLPEELTELRTLLQLQASFLGRGGEAEEAENEDLADPAARARGERLAALREQQRQHLNDCLLAFDDSVLFLHAQLLEHEKLGRRVRALQRRKQAVPAGRFRYDEGVECGSDDSDGVAAADDWRDWLTEAPPGVAAALLRGGGGGGGGGGGSGDGDCGGDGGDCEDDEASLTPPSLAPALALALALGPGPWSCACPWSWPWP